MKPASLRFFFLRSLFCCVLATFVTILLWEAGMPFKLQTLPICILGGFMVINTGELTLQLINGCSTRAYLPTAFVLGFAVISLAMLPLVFFVHLVASSAFCICGLGFIASWWIWGSRKERTTAQEDWVDIGVITVGALLILWFSRHIAQALPQLLLTGTLNAWIDYYGHGALIAQVGDSLAINRQNILFVDQPPIFYHYASYLVPAAMLSLTGLPGLGIATAILLPFGLLIAFAGLYGLGSELSGQVSGMFAVITVACLPDGSQYLLKNGFFGFHWLLFTAPGTGFAIGIAAIALILLTKWQRSGDCRHFVAATLLVVSLLVFRAHMFALMFPPFLAIVALTRWKARAHKIFYVSLGCFASLFAVLIADVSLREAWLKFARPIEFLDRVHYYIQPSAYAEPYDYVLNHYGRFASSLLGLALLPVAILGAGAFVYPAVQLLALRQRRWRTEDMFPVLLLLAWLGLVLFFPAPANSDLTELKQRPFPLVYCVLLVWLVSQITVLIRPGPLRERVRFWAPFTCFVALSLACMASFAGVDPANLRMAWARQAYKVATEDGLLRVAAYIRGRSRDGDVVAVGGAAKPTPEQLRTTMEIVSLTDIPAYTAYELGWRTGIRSSRVASERAEHLTNIGNSASREFAHELFREQGIRWYITIGGYSPNWDPERKYAELKAGTVMLYDSTKSH
jgi:hypothetical protein